MSFPLPPSIDEESSEDSDIVEKDNGTTSTSDASSLCTTPPTPLNVLITGGCGFLGRHIGRCVYQSMDSRFTDSKLMLLDRSSGGFKSCKQMICGDEKDNRIELGLADITNTHQLNNCFGSFQPDIVFHCAGMSELSAIIDDRLMYDRMEEANVIGTRCVVDACKENGVKVLIYTGSIAQVLPKQSQNQLQIDEGYISPIGNLLAQSYGKTKMTAERIVLWAGQTPHRRLRTCSIRCPPLYGEFDSSFIPNIVLAAQKHFDLYPPLGNSSYSMAAMYVGNAAHAHVCAASKLLHKDTNIRELVNSKFFIIGDKTPPCWMYDFSFSFLREFGYRSLWPRYLRMPIVITTIFFYMFIAVILFFHAFFHINFPSPILNYRKQIKIVSVNHIVIWCRAKQVLGYSPILCYETAFDRSVTWYKDHNPDLFYRFM